MRYPVDLHPDRIRASLHWRLLRWYALCVIRTATVQWEPPPTSDSRVWTVWHGQALVAVLAFSAVRPRRFPFLVGLRNRRGDAINRAYESLGGGGLQVTDRVKAGPAGAGKAELVAHLRAGGSCLITPDGPIGPARVARPGAAEVARAAGSVVVHLDFLVRRKVRLRRWDSFEIPLPWAVITAAEHPIE